MDLGLDRADLDKCVQCGLCLPHCPTYRVTGVESLSPRGRIALMRAVQLDGAPLTEHVLESFDTCVQCRGCEPACPSAVPYGHLIETTKAALVTTRRRPRGLQRLMYLLYLPLGRPRLLRALTAVLSVAARARVVPRRFAVPRKLPGGRHCVSGADVYLFTGCVMDAWQRHIHHDTQRVLESAGVGVTPTGDLAPCCGALHQHGGFAAKSRALATRTIEALSNRTPSADEPPILVNSAGCGAAMKDYGRLLNTDEARAFSARVLDVHEWLASHLDRLPIVEPLDLRVAIQDPCHLRHVQRVHEATRAVLAPFVRDIVELGDDGLCCGAGGAYSLLQPELARDILARKLSAIAEVEPDTVASANPGCSMHLATAGVTAEHPMTLIARALDSHSR